MRLEQLEYLCEIAKRKSMNQAAAKLFVSQQTLSTAIKNAPTMAFFLPKLVKSLLISQKILLMTSTNSS